MNILKEGKRQDPQHRSRGTAGHHDRAAAEAVLRSSIDGVTALNLDFAQLEYISSAGLRVLLSAQKVMKKQGTMVIRNVNATIMEVFEVTGFSDILTLE